MCVVSMIIDDRVNEWQRRYPWVNPSVPTYTYPPLPTKEEIEDFRRIYEKAKEYDKKNNEPDCEMEEKKKILKELADRLGVDISFVD